MYSIFNSIKPYQPLVKISLLITQENASIHLITEDAAILSSIQEIYLMKMTNNVSKQE